MKVFLLSLGVVLLSMTCNAEEKKEEKKLVGAFRAVVTPDELAKEFKDDQVKAEGKYKKPAPPVLGGAIIEIAGMIDGRNDGDKIITLKNNQGMIIVIEVPEMPKVKGGKIRVEVTGGEYKGYARKCITLRAGAVKYQMIIGEDKE